MNDLPNALLENYQQKSKELLLDLMSINTCQPEGNEDVLVNYLISVFPDGTEYQKLSHSANRSSLVVRVPGRSQENALAFFGHIDTVSYGNLDHWLYDPSHAGFDVCYGSSSLFPWVLASQLISLALTIFVFRYINLFDMTQSTWVATFITVVGAPPSIVLLYGPSISALLTSSVLASLLSAPVATWISTYIVGPLGVPGVVANVSTMAVVGVTVCYVCKILPWVKKAEAKPHRKAPAPADDVYSPGWFVRRCLAEFTEAQFYGNEVASIFLLLGVLIDWIISSDLPGYGGFTLPAILLSQFVGAAVGVFLYAPKFENGGWYATYVPVVSVGPACVLMFGANIPVAVFAGVLGGIIGAPLADFFATKLPEGVHGTNANVTSMALSTIIVSVVMKFLGIF